MLRVNVHPADGVFHRGVLMSGVHAVSIEGIVKRIGRCGNLSATARCRWLAFVRCDERAGVTVESHFAGQ